MIIRVVRWYKRMLDRQFWLMKDVRHWCMSSCAKALARSTLGFITALCLTVMSMFFVITNTDIPVLLASVYGVGIAALGALVMLPLGFRANCLAVCLIWQRGIKKQSVEE